MKHLILFLLVFPAVACEDVHEPCDEDGDGYGALECGGADCDDEDPSVHPGAEEVAYDGKDNDCSKGDLCDVDGDGHSADASHGAGACTGDDCDDTNERINPSADEVCNTFDDDCDGETDEEDAYGCNAFYEDGDWDGYGTATSKCLCGPERDFSALEPGDCDDEDPSAHPDAEEVVADGIDQDCDGDDACYGDFDGDAYGTSATVESEDIDCSDPGESVNGTDCDDTNDQINPEADEHCDGVDEDCDGEIDEDAVDAPTWYTDNDGDGYGDIDAEVRACEQPECTVEDDSDCDDVHATVHPGADEYCDGRDEDCDGTVDENPVDGSTWYTDNDGDGYGNPEASVRACDQPETTVEDDSDCDDFDASTYPGATELCDGEDNDCDGVVADGIYCDNDCDGVVDEGFRVPEDYATISEAIAAASDGDTVCVAAGTYVETIDFDGKDIAVVGYDGADSTIIDGDEALTVVTFDSGESPDAIMAGFTITNGGTGISVWRSSPRLEDMIVRDNHAQHGAPGWIIYIDHARLVMSDIEVSENSSEGDGEFVPFFPIVSVRNSFLVATNMNIFNNSWDPMWWEDSNTAIEIENSDVEWHGGSVTGHELSAEEDGIGKGMTIYDSLVVLDQVLIGSNTGEGAIYANNSIMTLTNVILSGNEADEGGALYLGEDTIAEIVNCDIVDNESEYGGVIFGDGHSSLVMVNTNVVGNSATYGGALYTEDSTTLGTTDISYSNFYDNGTDPFYGYSDPTGSDGNISEDPLYTDVSATDSVDWDLTLDPSSPCIDAGDPSILDADDTTSDIGAYGGPGGDW